MTLQKLKKTTSIQRFKRLILGSDKPNLITRASVISGFVIWLYLFSWQLLTFLSIILLGNLEQSAYIKAIYVHVGNAYDNNIINKLFLHSISQIIVYLIILAGLILIWRKRKIGFLMYIIGFMTSLIITFIILGLKYMTREIPVFDYILILSSLIYFSIGIIIFNRKSSEEL